MFFFKCSNCGCTKQFFGASLGGNAPPSVQPPQGRATFSVLNNERATVDELLTPPPAFQDKKEEDTQQEFPPTAEPEVVPPEASDAPVRRKLHSPKTPYEST